MIFGISTIVEIVKYAVMKKPEKKSSKNGIQAMADPSVPRLIPSIKERTIA